MPADQGPVQAGCHGSAIGPRDNGGAANDRDGGQRAELANLDWAVPDDTTLWCRQKTLTVQIPYRRADGPLNLPVDSAPVSATGSREPARVLPELPDPIPEGQEIGTLTADGPMTRADATPPSPCARPPRSSRSARTGGPGRQMPGSTGPKQDPAPPGPTAGHSGSVGPDPTPVAGSRRRCPHRFFRTCGVHRLALKAFAERSAARHPDCQPAEIQIRVALINRCNALGTAEIVRMA